MWAICIGDGVHVQNNLSLYEGVEIEDNVFCGSSCVFTNITTPRTHFPVHGVYVRILIKEVLRWVRTVRWCVVIR